MNLANKKEELEDPVADREIMKAYKRVILLIVYLIFTVVVGMLPVILYIITGMVAWLFLMIISTFMCLYMIALLHTYIDKNL